MEDDPWRFKKFILRGNVVDMAVGIIIGGCLRRNRQQSRSGHHHAPVGLVLRERRFRQPVHQSSGNLRHTGGCPERQARPLNVGVFVNTIINFIIVALVVFLVVKQVNRMQKPAQPGSYAGCKGLSLLLPGDSVKAKRCPNCTSELASQ